LKFNSPHSSVDLLSKEREMARLQKEIQRQVEEKMSKQQREYLLKEQLKNIKQVSSVWNRWLRADKPNLVIAAQLEK
jgi:ATP-dependent Lon protease